MKIGVIADTHVKTEEQLVSLKDVVEGHLSGVDMILHAGDLVSVAVMDYLEEVAPTVAVCGNMDFPEVKAALPTEEVIEAAGFKIGLTHGWGPPEGLIERVMNRFSDVDCTILAILTVLITKLSVAFSALIPVVPLTRFLLRRTRWEFCT